MRKKILTIITLISCLHLSAQNDYTFSIDSQIYIPLSNSTSITNGEVWYKLERVIPIGFEFNFFNETSTSLYMHGDFAATNIITTSPSPVGVHPWIIPFGAAIMDRANNGENEGNSGGLSNISYTIEGEGGNRIFKLEFSNIGFEEDIFNFETSTDYVNFQLWLYEDSNVIEIHFGESNTSHYYIDFEELQGPLLALMPQLSLDESAEGGPLSNFYTLLGNPENPEMRYEFQMNVLTGMPESGTVYRFAPTTMSIKDVSFVDEMIYPNPVEDVLFINPKLNVKKISFFNLEGKFIKEFIAPNASHISLRGIKSGLYNVVVEAEHKIEKRFKILVK